MAATDSPGISDNLACASIAGIAASSGTTGY